MKINKNINKDMTDNRRKFFKIAGTSTVGIFVLNLLPKSIVGERVKSLSKDKIQVNIHPQAISRERS